MIDANGQPQSVLVIGGGSDIAAAIVDRLVRLRCDRVILAGRTFSTMEAVRERVQSASPAKVDIVHFDLSDHEEIPNFVATTFGEFGPIDMVLLAGGILGDQAADEVDAKRVVEIANVNYVGASACLTECANRFKTQGFGTFVVLSSVAGERVRRSNYVYGASKAALDGFALGLSEALIPFGITVMVVRPGFVVSKMTAGMKRAPLSHTPEQVATDVIRALEQHKTLIWSPGILRWVMAIYRHLPRPLARRVPM